MAHRPLVQVFNKERKPVGQAKLAAVFRTPIRNDLVSFVHDQLSRNHRQAYAVSEVAGHQTAAESWGTGRAVARIPRVPGGGTHRAGQGAFGNMCRGGRIFAPMKIWRRWHRRVNLKQRRYAVASAIAGSALPALVYARGHKIDQVAEIPFVVQNEAFESLKKTKDAVALLKALGAHDDVTRVIKGKVVRAGQGKSRNRRFVSRRGPLVVYNRPGSFNKALRNIPGIELISVDRLNLLQLAPGGHLGRFVIWTQSAFERLDEIFGTFRVASKQKANYKLPRAPVDSIDINRVMHSQEVRATLRRAIPQKKKAPHRKNNRSNFRARVKLNPHYAVVKRSRILATLRGTAANLAKKKLSAPEQKIADARSKKYNRLRKQIRKNFNPIILA